VEDNIRPQKQHSKRNSLCVVMINSPLVLRRPVWSYCLEPDADVKPEHVRTLWKASVCPLGATTRYSYRVLDRDWARPASWKLRHSRGSPWPKIRVWATFPLAMAATSNSKPPLRS